MTLHELLAGIAPRLLERERAGELARALHDDEGHEAPLLVRIFTVVGTWVGAAMLAALVAALELYEVAPVGIVLALGCFALATKLAARPARTLAQTQLVWALALGAHGLLLGVADERGVGETAIAATWTLLNVALVFAIRVPSFGIASAVCAVGFATWLCDLVGVSALLVALPSAALATWVWIAESRLAPRLGRQWAAPAYGLPIGVVGPLTFVSVDAAGEHLVAVDGWSTSIATLVLLGLLAWVGFVARRELAHAPSEAASRRLSNPRTLALLGLALLALVVARHVPGLTLGLLFLALAQLRRSFGLALLGGIQLGAFTFFFYWQLDTTLLLKSLWVTGTGLVFLVAALVAGFERGGQGGRVREARWLPALVLAALTSGIVVGGAIQKERVLGQGETLLLPLAPVDPRSLMQGDYMVLRFALEQEMGIDELAWLDATEPVYPRHGRLIVRVDADRVGHFVRIDEGGPLAPDELRVEYRMREGWGGRLRIGAESFFFEEGRAEDHANARFGELRVAEDGEVVLVGLRDEHMQPLGVGLHDIRD